jgi:hypothetical protein
MIRRLLLPLLGSGLLLAAGASTVLGKCEGPNPPDFCSQVVASIDFGSTGATIRAGSETQLRVWVSRGEQPLKASSVALILARVADGTVIDATALPAAPGMWRTMVTLPEGGTWTVVAEVVDIDGNLVRLNLDALQVAAAPKVPSAPVTSPPVSPSTPALPIALLVAGVAAAGLLASVVRGRARRRTAGAAAGSAAAGNAASETA